MKKRFAATAMITVLFGTVLIPAQLVGAVHEAICDGVIMARDSGASTYTMGGVTYDIVENGNGGSGNQAIIGTEGADMLDGGSGSDIICGLGGADTLRGGSGNDILVGDIGLDAVMGGPQPGAGNDNIFGGSGSDNLYGDNGDDTLQGESGNDGHFGGAGTDTCIGGSGTNTVNSCE